MRYLTTLGMLLLCTLVGSADPCKSGPQVGQRPGPYSSLVAVGPQRGQQHCYICEAANRPLAIVFARSLSEPLGKLVNKLDAAVTEHKASELRSWVTFLAEEQANWDAKIVPWGQKIGVKGVPLGVFEDVVGPPTYLLSREADVTVLLSVNQKVVGNFAFRAGELNDAAIEAIIKALPRIVSVKK